MARPPTVPGDIPTQQHSGIWIQLFNTVVQRIFSIHPLTHPLIPPLHPLLTPLRALVQDGLCDALLGLLAAMPTASLLQRAGLYALVEILSNAPDCLLKLVLPPVVLPPAKPAPSFWSLFSIAKTEAEEEEEEGLKRFIQGPRLLSRLGFRASKRSSITSFSSGQSQSYPIDTSSSQSVTAMGATEITQRAAGIIEAIVDLSEVTPTPLSSFPSNSSKSFPL